MDGEPTSKEARYDRQLRLWGEHGQENLEAAHIAVIGGGGLATETLKSLILPGVGAFTIYDNENSTTADLGENFFVQVDCVGQARAKVTCELLNELNTEVKGNWMAKSASQLADDPSPLSNASLVVVATDKPTPETVLVRIAEFLWQRSVPLLIVRVSGLFGFIQPVIRQHLIYDSKPSDPFNDLRVDSPFEALQAYVDAIQLDSLSHVVHSHVPYVVILIKLLQKYCALNDVTLPLAREQKYAFRKLILEAQMADEKGSKDEENFHEAANAVISTLARSSSDIPSQLKVLFEEADSQEGGSSAPFWLLVRALKRFTESHNCLPVRGTLPDMISDSESYVNLLNVYREKAKQDAEEVLRIIHSLPGSPATPIKESRVREFCRQAAFVNVVRTDCLSKQWSTSGASVEAEDAALYVLLRAHAQLTSDSKEAPSLPVLLERASTLSGGRSAAMEQLAPEVLRARNTQLHTTAAVLGSLAAHEVVKLITHQYAPLGSTFVYNGLNCAGSVI